MTARGIRNNNPGNIVYVEGEDWEGQTGSDGHFAIFDTAEHGLRALALNFLAYQRKHGLRTVRGMITRHCPPLPGTENNNTAAYIVWVASQLDVDPDQDVDLTDPALLKMLLIAVCRQEDGSDPYDDATMDAAVADALGLA